MKATRALALFTSLFLTIVLVSCKKTDLSTEASEDPAAKPKIVLVTGAPIELPDCWSTCIKPEGPYIESSGFKTQTWGNTSNPHWKRSEEHTSELQSQSNLVCRLLLEKKKKKKKKKKKAK